MLAFDIETYADFAGLPASTRAYLTRRDEARGIGPRDRRAVGNKAALLPGVAQVIAIGLWGALDGAERLSLSLVPDLASERAEAFGEGGVRLLRFRQEADLLEAFWQRCEAALRSGRRLVSFHGRSFDGPILALRSAVLGVRPRVQLVGHRSATRPHLDLAELLSFFGARRERYGLDYWCAAFQIESPKQDLDGAAVGAAFEGGRHRDIARYALEDARATGELFLRLADTLLPLAEESA